MNKIKAFSALSFVTLSMAPMAQTLAQKPNVIIVLTDDQGYGDLGCLGNTVIKTTNLDSFYNQSVRFTNYQCVTHPRPNPFGTDDRPFH